MTREELKIWLQNKRQEHADFVFECYSCGAKTTKSGVAFNSRKLGMHCQLVHGFSITENFRLRNLVPKCACGRGQEATWNANYRWFNEYVDNSHTPKWNTGLTKETDSRVKRQSEKVGATVHEYHQEHPELGERMSKERHERYYSKEWQESEAGKRSLAAGFSNERQPTKEQLIRRGKALSVTLKKKPKDSFFFKKGHTPYFHTHPKWKSGHRPDLNGQYFRSSWEANFARLLNLKKISWEYEPETFKLSDGTGYTPDFRLRGNNFVELKGYQLPTWQHKFALFKQDYPEIKISLLHGKKYSVLSTLYRYQISNWE